MNTTIKLLAEAFSFDCETERKIVDFSPFNITVPPPPDLVEMLALFGSGTFHCASGDSIRIFLPDKDASEFLRYAFNSCKQVMMEMGDDYDYDEMTIPKSFFEEKNENGLNMIYWGHSDNGIMFCSLYLSEKTGWATVLIDGDFQRMACYFKSSAAVVRTSFFSKLLSSFFPKSSGPYRFDREP